MGEKTMGLSEAKVIAQKAANSYRAFKDLEEAAQAILNSQSELRENEKKISELHERRRTGQQKHDRDMEQLRMQLANAKKGLEEFIGKSKEQRREEQRDRKIEKQEAGDELAKVRDYCGKEATSLHSQVDELRVARGTLQRELEELKKEAGKVRDRASALGGA